MGRAEKENGYGRVNRFFTKPVVVLLITTIIGPILSGVIVNNLTENKTYEVVKKATVEMLSAKLDYIDASEDLADAIDEIAKRNEAIKKQSSENDDVVNEKNKEIQTLKLTIDSMPKVEYNSIGVVLNGLETEEKIKNGWVSIDGINYFSEESINSLLESKVHFNDDSKTLSYDTTETSNASLTEYDKLTTAELKTPTAIISGEQYSSTSQEFQAVINGHNYYLEEFLNSFLEYDLVCEGGTLYYHTGVPERVALSKDMIYEKKNVQVVDKFRTYTMELEEYNNGLTFLNTSTSIGNAEMKIACKGEYSAIEFKLGHIDDKKRTLRDITISYQNDNGAFVTSEEIRCTWEMPVTTYTIPIYNTRVVKITSGVGGQYLLTDIYLIK